MNYKEQLLTSQWLRKKSKILQRDNYTCTMCGGTDCVLQVHHTYYIVGKLAWQHPDKSLITLCTTCHEKWHKQHVLEFRESVWCKTKDYKGPKQKILHKVKTKSQLKREASERKRKRLLIEHKVKHHKKVLARTKFLKDWEFIEYIKDLVTKSVQTSKQIENIKSNNRPV